MKSTTKMMLFGDICPTNDTLSLFESGDAENLFNAVLVYLIQDYKKAVWITKNL